MKCPSCGAETSGKFCEYCGSEMPKGKVVGKCPKCGDANVSFKRERVGTATQSRSHKNAFGNGRNGHSVSQTAYRTVGICQSCGYTWNPNGGTQRSGKKTWLWVLGWICIFPLPLTILMLRKKNMKPAVKYGIIAAAWLLFFAIGSSGNSETDTTQNNIPAPTEIVQVEQATTATTEAVPETTENDSPWAKQEENIRRFVSEFNEISDTPVKEIEFRNNHTIAYFIADGFSITNIKVNDHDDIGFTFTFEFSDGKASLEKYEKFMTDVVKVFDPNVDVGDKFKEANANLDTFIHLSDSISVKYHYIKDAIGYQAGDTYIITLISADYTTGKTNATVVSDDAFITEIKTSLDGAIGEGEAIADVVLNGTDLLITVDFTNADPAPLTLSDLAWSRASSITDAVLTFAEYDELWETITIDFGEAGSVVCNKSDVVSTEYGRYIPSTVFDSLIGIN